MPKINDIQETPNPNAVKCWLDRPISDRPRSFLNTDMAREDAIAAALFDRAGVNACEDDDLLANELLREAGLDAPEDGELG